VTDIWTQPQCKYLAGKFIKCEIQPDIISPFAELPTAYILKSTPEKSSVIAILRGVALTK